MIHISSGARVGNPLLPLARACLVWLSSARLSPVSCEEPFYSQSARWIQCHLSVPDSVPSFSPKCSPFDAMFHPSMSAMIRWSTDGQTGCHKVAV